MTRTRTNTHVALLIGALLGLAGCGGGSGGGAATGTLSLGLTDSPVDAEAVMIQFAGLELKPAGGPPELYEFNPEACDEYDSALKTCTINLLDLWGTEKRTIFVRDLPVGEYQWVRLLVNAERNVMDSFITVRDELEATMDCPLWIPSGSETGLKIVSGITVATNGSRYMLDFDVNKSVKRPPGLVVPPANPPTVEAMCAQNYVLTPAIRIVDETEAGSIAGIVDSSLFPVTGCEANAEGFIDDLEVYVFEDFTANAELDDYDDITDEMDPVDPVASAIVKYDKNSLEYSYEVGYLLTGNYLLGLACNTDLDFDGDDFDVNADGLQECGSESDPAFCFVADRTVDVQADMMSDGDFPDVP